MVTYEDIEQWFDRHFNGTTPGTELYAMQQRAKADLHSILGTDPAMINAPKAEPETHEN